MRTDPTDQTNRVRRECVGQCVASASEQAPGKREFECVVVVPSPSGDDALNEPPPTQSTQCVGRPRRPHPSELLEHHPEDCPECRQGKHHNCTGWAIDPNTDDLTECGCALGGHA